MQLAHATSAAGCSAARAASTPAARRAVVAPRPAVPAQRRAQLQLTRAATLTVDTLSTAEGMEVEAFEEVLRSSGLVLADFYTTWCGPCKILAGGMAAIEPSYKGKIHFAKIDCEKNYKVSQNYKVSKLPTLILFKDGEVLDRHEGVLSGQDLDMKLKGLLKKAGME